MLVPPPMAASTLVCPSPINEIAFGPCPGSNDVLAYLSTGQIALFETKGISKNLAAVYVFFFFMFNIK